MTPTVPLNDVRLKLVGASPRDLTDRVTAFEPGAKSILVRLDNLDLALLYDEGLVPGAVLDVSHGDESKRIVVSKVRGFTTLLLECVEKKAADGTL